MSTSRVFTVGQVLTAAQMNDLPQGVLGKTAGTADVGPTSGTTELDVVTAPAVTIAGTTRRIRISFHAPNINGNTANDGFLVRIKEGATTLAEASWANLLNGAGLSIGTDFVAIVDNPSAASHTYKATIQRASGTGTATVHGSSTGPIVITVEDVGQV